MSFGSNNSRNIANLLRHDQLEPLQPQVAQQGVRNVPVQGQNPVYRQERGEIAVEDVFTPQENTERMPLRRRTPVSSGGNGGNGSVYIKTNRQDELQLESFKTRLEQIVKYYDERHSNLETKMMVRLNELENFVMKEVPKIDNNAMVNADLVGFKQALRDVRKQQEYQQHELNTLKAMSSSKDNSDALMVQNNQDKEKMTVLFMELVRLGDTYEKITDNMNSVSRNYEAKMQELQHKVANSQKNMSMMSQRSSSGNQVLNEFGDKLLSRLQASESNLLILGKEQVKDKDLIAKLVSQNERMGEDIQQLMRNVQNEFQNKLENRISEAMNRLIFEHEERIKAHEEIKKNLDLREKITQEKQINEKMETKARYDTMDSLVRNQFLKKEESIRLLSQQMEVQFSSYLKEIQTETLKRKEEEAVLRSQIKRVQENYRKEYDLYKNHQNELVDKLTDMIKAEISVRLSSQIDLKKLTTDVANQLVTDLNNIKEALSSSNKKVNFSLKEVANESSERSAQLSHYIDNEIKKVVDVVTEKYSKMKNIFTKLAQQLKNHLLNTETNRRNVETRLTAIEGDYEKLQGKMNHGIDQLEQGLEARLKEEKEFVETVVFKKNNDLTLRVNKLEEYTNQYFQLLKTGIEDNKELLHNKLSGAAEEKQPENEEQLKELRRHVFSIRGIVQEIKDEHKELTLNFQKQIRQGEAKNKEDLQSLENNLISQIGKNTDKMVEIDDALSDITVKLNGLRVDSNSGGAISNDKVKRVSDEVDSLTKKIKDVEEKALGGSNKNEEDIIILRNDVNVLKGELGALDHDLKKIANS